MAEDYSPKFSVIVATLNSSKTIRQCISSVVDQTFDSFELMVIDGGSTDETKAIVESFGNNVAYFISEPDKGVYEAFNKGVLASNGEWVMFLGADDYLHDCSTLENLFAFLKNNVVDERIIYGQIATMGEKDDHDLFGKPWNESKHEIKRFMSIPHVGMAHHRSLFTEKGLFNESFKVAGDYEFVLRELLYSDALFIPNLVIAHHRSGGLSTNPQFGHIVHFELWKARRLNGINFPGFRWLLRTPRVLFLPTLIAFFGTERGLSLHQKFKKRPHGKKSLENQ